MSVWTETSVDLPAHKRPRCLRCCRPVERATMGYGYEPCSGSSTVQITITCHGETVVRSVERDLALSELSKALSDLVGPAFGAVHMRLSYPKRSPMSRMRRAVVLRMGAGQSVV